MWKPQKYCYFLKVTFKSAAWYLVFIKPGIIFCIRNDKQKPFKSIQQKSLVMYMVFSKNHLAIISCHVVSAIVRLQSVLYSYYCWNTVLVCLLWLQVHFIVGSDDADDARENCYPPELTPFTTWLPSVSATYTSSSSTTFPIYDDYPSGPLRDAARRPGSDPEPERRARSTPAEDLAALVACCEHSVVSVGSFGWWSAYLKPRSSHTLYMADFCGSRRGKCAMHALFYTHRDIVVLMVFFCHIKHLMFVFKPVILNFKYSNVRTYFSTNMYDI